MPRLPSSLDVDFTLNDLTNHRTVPLVGKNLVRPAIAPNQTWTLLLTWPTSITCEEGYQRFHFTAGPNGWTLLDLLGFIGDSYAELVRQHPPKQHHSDEFGSFDVPFWGDHCFLECIRFDRVRKGITLQLGS